MAVQSADMNWVYYSEGPGKGVGDDILPARDVPDVRCTFHKTSKLLLLFFWPELIDSMLEQ
jgi:hypothetical protein